MISDSHDILWRLPDARYVVDRQIVFSNKFPPEFITTADADLYQSPAWLAVIRESYGYEIHSFELHESRSETTASILYAEIKSVFTGNRRVSLPFSDYSTIVAKDEESKKTLLEQFARFNDSVSHLKVEIRTLDTSTNIDFPGIFVSSCYYTYLLDLKRPIDVIWDGFHKNYIKRNIKKAETMGLEIRESAEIADLKRLYTLYVNTRRAHRLIPQPYKFFQTMRRHFKGNGFSVMLCRLNGKAIAGILLVMYGDTMHYLYAGSLEKYLSYRPNHLLLWTAIRNAHARGASYFNFGRTTEENEGLMNFKISWGPEKRTLVYYQMSGKSIDVVNRKTSHIAVVEALIRKSPKVLLRMIGRIIYKHLG